jgi:hypothetical protein
MNLKDLCKELELSNYQCEVVSGYVQTNCGRQRSAGAKPRARSKWQECIATRRAGTPFDPQAIRELAKEYKEGKCP